MRFGDSLCFTYDSLNRLTSAGDHDYIYNAENVRMRNLCTGEDTTYVYNTNCKLSQLLVKTTNGVTTKYVYGLGLVGEETNSVFKTYHFDSRGSTVAITDASGNITDTFAYDTYGKCISRTGISKVIFGYNGRDGVVTDKNGLIYMRARYYSPNMRRFINADIIAGELSNAITLNRYAYANGNPVSFIDPFGLWSLKGAWNSFTNWVSDTANNVKDWAVDTYNDAKDAVVETYNEVKDWAVDTYNDVKERAVDTYNDVKEWVEDAKVAVKDFGEKAGNAFLNSIEAEAGVGYGFGKSFKAGIFEIEAQAYSDNFTVRLDDNEVFMDNSGSAGISANILDQKKMSFGVSGSYHHDYVDRPNDCKEHHAWSNPFSVATCEHADKTPMSFSVPIKGSIGADISEDVVLGISGATHIGVGYHYSVGFNFSQFWRELWE
jgi:RHS repeat-associated protein